MTDRVTFIAELPAGALTVTAAPPELVSQRTSEAVLGIPRRPYLESLPAYRASGGEVLSIGKLRLVERVRYLAWLRRRRTAESAAEQDGTAGLAAELGLHLVSDRR